MAAPRSSEKNIIERTHMNAEIPLTMVSLRDYVDQRFSDSALSVEEAKKTIDARLILMNEFRGALNDVINKTLTRSEYQLHQDRLIEDIRSLRESRAELSGKASMKAVVVSLMIASVGVLLSSISLIHQLMK